LHVVRVDGDALRAPLSARCAVGGSDAFRRENIVNNRVWVAALAAGLGTLVTRLPAQAQAMTTAAAPVDNGGLLWVWVWILVIGVIAIVGGASVGNMGGKR
jgi:hypothetical protein